MVPTAARPCAVTSPAARPGMPSAATGPQPSDSVPEIGTEASATPSRVRPGVSMLPVPRMTLSVPWSSQ